MIETTSKTTQRERFVFVPAVLRRGEWLARRCRCGRVGWVAIYPGREVEALRKIISAMWVCAECEREYDAVERAREKASAEVAA